MTQTTHEAQSTGTEVRLTPNGPAAAVLLSASVGVFITGLATVLAAASPFIKNALNWWNPAGPLSGKTGAGVIASLLSWALLHLWLRRRETSLRLVWVFSLLGIILGFLMTFPPIFKAFESHP